MFGWLDELFNLRLKYREYNMRLEMEARKCDSCEVLQVALERSNYEKEQLLRKILNPEPETQNIKPAEEPQLIRKHVPWKIRQQLLEEEDRNKAKVIAEFKNRTSELEKDLSIENSKREEDAKAN